MLSVAEAQQAILSNIKRLDPETVDLLSALGRVLAEDVVSDVDLPPFDNSAMDGYAIRADDVQGASIDRPVRLPVITDIPAGTYRVRFQSNTSPVHLFAEIKELTLKDGYLYGEILVQMSDPVAIKK